MTFSPTDKAVVTTVKSSTLGSSARGGYNGRVRFHDMNKRADLTRLHGFNGGGVSICECLDEDASCHELARPDSLSVVFKGGFKSEKFSVRVGLDVHEKQLAAGERAIVLFGPIGW